MSAEGARIIDLDEYRRRRVERSAQPPLALAPPIVWVPVWLWVPVWPIA